MFLDKPSKIVENRLKKVIVSDKKSLSPQLIELLKSDIYSLLDNYLSLDKDSFDINININELGKYQLTFNATANYLKSYGIII